jgi:thiol:disulfide interchange protein
MMIRTPAARALIVRLKLQGCADAGLCYPPEVRQVKIALPAPAK